MPEGRNERSPQILPPTEMNLPGAAVFIALAIGYVVLQRVVRTWVAREWVAERISNLTAVVVLLLSSTVGIGAVILIGATVLNPSLESVLVLLPFLFIALVVFGVAMTAINYAALHGVREHLRAQRDRQAQTGKQ